MPFFDQYPYTNFHNVNLDWVLERVKEWGALVEENNTAFHNLEEANENFKNYVTSYLENLDVQEEINNKLDSMLESGVLTDYLQPYVSSSVTTWLDENITEPEGVVIDSSLTVAGACADAKATGDLLKTTIKYTEQNLTDEQKAQARLNIGALSDTNQYSSIFAFRLLNGNIANNGDLDTDYTKRMITRGCIYLRSGDKIYCDDSSLNFGICRYSDYNASSTTFIERVKAVTTYPNPLTINIDGWYVPIVQYTDSRTITTENRRYASLHVYGVRQALTGVERGTLNNKYAFWFSSTEYDGEVTTDVYCKGLNSKKTNIHTLPFYFKKGVTLNFPSNMYWQIAKYINGDMRKNTYTGSWTLGGTYTASEDEWITLNISKLNIEEYTDINDAIAHYNSISVDVYEDSYFNAKLNGCLGNGNRNEAPAIQAILNKIRDLGGGTIYFPAGQYEISNTLIIYTGTNIELDNNAALYRGANINFMFVTDCNDNTLNYDGVKYIRISGGRFNITPENYTSLTQGSCAFGFIHASRIIIEGCEFYHNNSGYHMLDICGCKNVVIKNCYLHTPVTDQSSAELIQFDGAGSRTQFPSPQLTEGAPTFDGTPSKNIEVCGCVFETNNYSPALGNHNTQLNENIDIHDNVISGLAGDRGIIAFEHNNETTHTNRTTKVFIHHNLIEGANIGFAFSPIGNGRIFVRDNIFNNITTLKKNPDSQVGVFYDNIEMN